MPGRTLAAPPEPHRLAAAKPERPGELHRKSRQNQ
jgi:hypothetical protein